MFEKEKLHLMIGGPGIHMYSYVACEPDSIPVDYFDAASDILPERCVILFYSTEWGGIFFVENTGGHVMANGFIPCQDYQYLLSCQRRSRIG